MPTNRAPRPKPTSTVHRSGVPQFGAGFCPPATCWRLARLRTLTMHHGRHMFISHALAGERTLADVCGPRWGRTNLPVTSIYLDVVVDDHGGLWRRPAFVLDTRSPVE
jgi:hypothetical protein